MANTRSVTGLADAIDALRAELTDAMERGDGQDMRFRIQPIELTVQVVVTTGGNGKIGWGLVGIGGERRSATTHELRIQLAPVWRRADGSYVEDFTIADQSRDTVNFGPRVDGHGTGE